MPEAQARPCSQWCPFIACTGCPYQGGTLGEDSRHVSSNRDHGDGAAGLAPAPRLTPNSCEEKRLP